MSARVPATAAGVRRMLIARRELHLHRQLIGGTAIWRLVWSPHVSGVSLCGTDDCLRVKL